MPPIRMQSMAATTRPFQAVSPVVAISATKQWKVSTRRLIARRSTEPETNTAVETTPGAIVENPDSEAARRKATADRLRAAEKFMVIGEGSATCKSCSYEYTPEKGDPDFPLPKGMRFETIPAEYVCPVCGAPKDQFVANSKVIPGFAQNQKYGIGTNGMTSDNKLLLIYGSLLAFFGLFIAGYSME